MAIANHRQELNKQPIESQYLLFWLFELYSQIKYEFDYGICYWYIDRIKCYRNRTLTITNQTLQFKPRNLFQYDQLQIKPCSLHPTYEYIIHISIATPSAPCPEFLSPNVSGNHCILFYYYLNAALFMFVRSNLMQLSFNRSILQLN